LEAKYSPKTQRRFDLLVGGESREKAKKAFWDARNRIISDPWETRFSKWQKLD